MKEAEPTRDVFRGKHGIPSQPDLAIGEARPDDIHWLILPGGYSPDHMRRSTPMVEFVRSMHEAGKPVAAICHAGWMLASAGIVKDRRLTSFFSIKDDLVHAGAQWVDEEVVEDRGIITSRSPADLPAFCRAIIRNLTKT